MTRLTLIATLCAGLLTSTVTVAKEFTLNQFNSYEPLAFSRVLAPPLNLERAGVQEKYGDRDNSYTDRSGYSLATSYAMLQDLEMEISFNRAIATQPSFRNGRLGFGYQLAMGGLNNENRTGPVYQSYDSAIGDAWMVDYRFDNNNRVGLIRTGYFTSSVDGGSKSRWNMGFFIGKRF